jgi:Xaa-Pro aminopeptidase
LSSIVWMGKLFQISVSEGERMQVFRLEKLKQAIKDMGMDAVWITKRENYIYYSGFNGTSCHVCITPHHQFLFTDSRYVEQAEAQAEGFVVIDYGRNFLEVFREKLMELGIKTLGFENEAVSYAKYMEFVSGMQGIEWKGLDHTLANLRIIKDEAEIAIIRKAVALADKAFSHGLSYIKEGVSERDIAAEIEYFLKKNGATGTSFETIVASGHRSALPHGVASDKKIQNGDAIVIDFGALYQDYCSDMTRTVFLGKPQPELSTIYQLVKNAQEIAANGICEGMTTKEADALARDVIHDGGYGPYFTHGLGHGVGIEIHEGPTLSYKFDNPLKSHMVVTVEPGVYVKGMGGVRIEDMIVIGVERSEILTQSSKEWIVL